MSTIVEVSVPTPWGHIAAKTWGLPGKPKVLAVHGLNDNAASFDHLISLLKDDLFVICIDLPGHGLSSHFPPGICFSVIDYIQVLKYVVDHVGWHQFHIMAHSFGSHVSLYFAALYSQSVHRILLIDPFLVHIIPERKFILERFQIVMDKHLNFQKEETIYFTYEECLKRIREGRQKGLRIESARALQRRAFSKTTNGFIYNNDRRLKMLTYPLITPDLHNTLVKAVSCEVMVILTSEFEPLLTPTSKNSLKMLRQGLGPGMKFARVEGSHDVHLDHPCLVGPIIKHFFTLNKSHL